MNITKYLLVVLLYLGTSTKLFAGYYYFVGSYTPGSTSSLADISNPSDWYDPNTGLTASNFTTSGDVFDFFNVWADMKGITIGDVEFTSTALGSGFPNARIYNSGTVTVTSSVAPRFLACVYLLDSFTTSKFEYNTGNQDIAGINYYDIVLSGGDKNFSNSFNVAHNCTFTGSTYDLTFSNGGTIQTLSFSGSDLIFGSAVSISNTTFSGSNYTVNNTGNSISNVTFNSAANVNLNVSTTIENTTTINENVSFYVNANTTLSSSAVFTIASGKTPKYYLNTQTAITDNRSSKTYPSEWIVNSNPVNLNFGTYENLTINDNAIMLGSITVTNILDLSFSTSAKYLNLNGLISPPALQKTLTVSGTVNSSSNGVKITGTLGSSIALSKSSQSYTLYFDQTNATSRNLRNLTLSNGSSLVIGNDLNISNLITLNNGTLTLNGNTLTFVGGASPISRTTGTINASASNSKVLFAQTTANIAATLLATAFPLEIAHLEIAFPSGGTLTQNSGAITTSANFTLSNSNNFYNLNGQTLTIKGNLNNTNGSTGGKFKGSATSSLVCGATGTLYFNQTGTDSTLKNLTINNSKTVDLGNNLKIVGGSSYGVVTVESGATLNTNGYLTLRSHAGGSAMIGNSPGTISGSIMVETFVPATARRYRFLSSPVTGATAVHWRNNGTYTKYKGIQITGGGANWSAQGFDESQTNNPSAFYYNEAAAGDDTTVSPGASNDAGWTAFSSGSEALVNGKGFRVLVRGDRGIDLKGTGGSTSPIATTLKVTGSYVGTSATINVTNSGRTKLNNGINFVGNPYPCTIDWDALTLTNVDPSYLIYDPSGNRYRAWNGTTGGAGRYISSGQAFLVYCTSTSGGSITVNESDKVTNTTGGSFFQTKLTNHLKIELAYDTLNLDETYIHFREDATDRLDRFDVRQVKNSGVNIASIDSANLAYNINSLGNLTGSRRIPLSVEGTAISNGFKLTFNDVATFPFHKIYLIDNFKGTKTLLQEAATFVVDITADKSSYQNGRFYLDFEELPQTNIKKINSDMGLVLFPNPANDIINLEFGNTLKNKNFQFNISSIHGESVLAGNLTAAEQNKINIKNLASGIYFINISNSEKSQSIQFIKK